MPNIEFNPKIKDLLEKNPNITVLGLWWAMYWRIFLLSAGIVVVWTILVAILGKR